MYEYLSKRIIKEIGVNKEHLSKSEESYVASWKESLKFKDEIIMEAVKRSKKASTNSVNFAYINAILENWHKNKVNSYTDILNLDKEYNKKKDKSSYKTDKVVSSGQVIFKIENDDVTLPDLNEELGCYEIYAYVDNNGIVVIPSKEKEKIETGLIMTIPKGYIGVINTLDNQYSSEMTMFSSGFSTFYYGGVPTKINCNIRNFTSKEKYIKNGELIARLIIIPCVTPEITVI